MNTKYSGDPELEDPGLCDALPGGEAGLRGGVPQALLNTLRRTEEASSPLSFHVHIPFHSTNILRGPPFLLKPPLQLLTAHYSHISAINKYMLEYLKGFDFI